MSSEISPRIKQVVMYPDGRMDTKNASSYLGLSEKTMAMMRCQGTGPAFIKRGRIFYYKNILDEWLKAAEFTSTAQAQHAAEREQGGHGSEGRRPEDTQVINVLPKDNRPARTSVQIHSEHQSIIAGP